MEGDTTGLFIATVDDMSHLILSEPTELMRLTRNEAGDLVITINREATFEQIVAALFGGRVPS